MTLPAHRARGARRTRQRAAAAAAAAAITIAIGTTVGLVLPLGSGALAASRISATNPDPQPELAQYKVAATGGNGAGADLPDGTIVLATTTTASISSITVCRIPLGARACASTAALHATPGVAGLSSPQVLATGGKDVTIVAYDGNLQQSTVEFTSTDDGLIWSAEKPVGNLGAYTYATFASGTAVTASNSAGAMTVQALPETANTVFATLGSTIDEQTSITTYDGGVLVAYDNGDNTYVYYARAGADFNESSAWTDVGTFHGETVSSLSSDALLTDIGGSLTGGERLRFFNGTSFSAPSKVPEPTNGDDGGFTMEKAGGAAHVFFIDRREGYDLFAEASSDGSTWSVRQQFASAIAASEFVPVLGSIGTGIVYEGDSTPVLAQPILDAQAVHITIAPATVTPGHHAVLSGTVAPKVAGLHVTIEKFFEGTWEPVGATLVESASGTFHTDVSVESEYRAVVADDPGLYEYGYSNGAYLTVKVPAS
jgi:hypothetical protein